MNLQKFMGYIAQKNKPLEEIIEGWKVDPERKILYDSSGNVYEFHEITRRGDLAEIVMRGGNKGIILSGEPGIYHVKDILDGYYLLKKLGKGERLVSIDGRVRGRLYESFSSRKILDGKVYAVVRNRNDGSWRIVKIDKEGETRSSVYEEIKQFEIKDAIVYAKVKDEGGWRIVKLNNCLLYTSPSPRD